MPQKSSGQFKYSIQVLEEAPGRAVKFINGVGADAHIRTLLAGVGMTDDDLAEGGKLLLACLYQSPGKKVIRDTDEARAQRAAVAELDQWDEPNFTRYAAALHRHHPSACDYVFFDLAASTGAAAVAGVATFLRRLEALEKGSDPERADSRKDDKKAIELLATRGLDKKERARLQGLVDLALKPTTTLDIDPLPTEERSAARIAALTDLKDWYEEWSSAARTVLKKRPYLLRLGLAKRKTRKGDPASPGPDAASPPK